MTATVNFRQTAQYIGLAIFGLMVRTAFGVFGILWGIIREIVNGVFRVAAAQQCRYYEVDNIFVYMVETYINGNISVFRELYHELNKDARRDFMDFLLSEVEPTYWREILKQTI